MRPLTLFRVALALGALTCVLARGGVARAQSGPACTPVISPPASTICTGSSVGDLLRGSTVTATFDTTGGPVVLTGTVGEPFSLPPGGTGGGPTAGATPELDSLFLFGAGAAGLASYVRLRWRSRRRISASVEATLLVALVSVTFLTDSSAGRAQSAVPCSSTADDICPVSGSSITGTWTKGATGGDFRLDITVPAGTLRGPTIGFTTTAGPESFALSVTVPNVTGVDPPYLADEVVVAVDHLDYVRSVQFGRIQAQIVNQELSTDLFGHVSDLVTVRPPTGNVGIVDVTVSGGFFTSAIVPEDRFSYAPIVTRVSPAIGPASGGTPVSVEGHNLQTVFDIEFGFSPILSWDSARFCVLLHHCTDQLTFTAPEGSGTVDVRVASSTGGSELTPADRFSYLPAINSLSPNWGPGAGGTTVVLRGLSFTGAQSVRFGASAASAFHVDSDIQITATAPAGAQVADVLVTTPIGTSSAQPLDRFAYLDSAPIVTGVTPAIGPAGGGTAVTISGSAFALATQVLFGNTPATVVSSDGATQLVVLTPPGAGIEDVHVVGPAGTSATIPADQFTFVGVPVVSSISPTSGPVGGGTSITIRGTALSAATSVSVGSVRLSRPDFTVVNDSTITLATPSATLAGPVDIVVTSPGGTSQTTAVDHFTYVAPRGRGYVANAAADSISVIDLDANTSVNTIGLPGSAPSAVAIDSTGTLLYVAGRSNNTIYQLDAATGAVLATFNTRAAGGACGPISIALNSTNSRLYVEGADCFIDTISVLDTSSRNHLGLIANVPNVAHGGSVAVLDEIHRVYFASSSQVLNVVGLDSQTLQAVDFLGNDSDSFGLFTRDGVTDQLWLAVRSTSRPTWQVDVVGVACGCSPDVRDSPPSTGGFTQIGNFGTDVRGIAASGTSASGGFGVIADRGANAIWIARAAGDTVQASSVPVGRQPVAVALTPDGALAYVANQGDGSVSVVDTAAHTVVATIPVGASPASIAVSSVIPGHTP